MKTLVAGWFSFENGHPTAGDLLARDLVCRWLEEAGYRYDVALAPPFQGGVYWSNADPQDYPLVVFVCGPFGRRGLATMFLRRFAKSRLIGLNLSMELPLDTWNPFDYLIERDSSDAVNADMVFLAPPKRVPLVGLCLVEAHPGAKVDIANALIDRFVSSREISLVRIDTRLDVNETGLRTPAEIESLIAHTDVLITTRLHGLVLALKNGVPVIAVDAVPGGGKIRSQGMAIGWPLVFALEETTDEILSEAFDYCLTNEARRQAATCGELARRMADSVHQRFVSTLLERGQLESRFRERNTPEGIERFLAAAGTAIPPVDLTIGASDQADEKRGSRTRERLWRSLRSRLRLGKGANRA